MMTKETDYLSEDIVILALRRSLGNLGITAADLNISRGQLQDYLVSHELCREERRQIRESIKDQAEDLLIEKMKTSDALLMFFLRTQAKDRGYDSNVTMSGPNGGPIAVNVNARALIAAMRNGFDNAEDEEEPEDSDLLDEPVHSFDERGGGDRKMLPELSVLHT